MRFSDMMGSGNDQSAPAEADTVVADALAPYLDAPVTPPRVEPAAEPETAPDAVADAVSTPRVPDVAVKSVASVFGGTSVAPGPREAPVPPAPVTAPSFADFTPLSDDLLPRKR